MENIFVVLIHGTWAGEAKWIRHGSFFRKGLSEKLIDDGYNKVDFKDFTWSGKQREKERSKVIDELVDYLTEECDKQNIIHNKNWDLLVVGHSHGGNIATEGVRKWLIGRQNSSNHTPNTKVVCMSTPFLSQERRSSWMSFLFLALISVLFMAFLSYEQKFNNDAEVVLNLAQFIPGLSFSINLVYVAFILGFDALILILFLFLRNNFPSNTSEWEPRPKVLCISCPDDEAITGLGLIEGVTNLPQLLLYPLLLVIGFIIFFCFFIKNLIECHYQLHISCFERLLDNAVIIWMIWVTSALLLGLIGAFIVVIAFGLPLKDIFKNMVIRVLVSYTPLRPAQPYFRSIDKIKLNPKVLLLWHCALYETPEVIDEIVYWLKTA